MGDKEAWRTLIKVYYENHKTMQQFIDDYVTVSNINLAEGTYDLNLAPLPKAV